MTPDQPDQPRPARRRASRLVDIAEAVGVHTSTVSRVLNGDPAQSVRPEVHEKIWDTARQQGYRPNALARALKQRRTGALAFVIPLLRNPIWVRLQRGALQRAGERGYVVMIMEEPGDAPQPPASYRYLVEESRADGLLLATSLRIPAHAGGGPPGRLAPVPHVYVNRRGPGRGAQLTVLHADATEEGGWAATQRLLDRGTRDGGTLPTACAVGSLNQLFGVMAALRAAGLAVPAGMSVVSLDEDECLAFLDVPVSAVAMPLAELGSAAVDALIDRIEQRPAGDVMIREPMSLVLRQSVAGPPADRKR
jgi:LacI family transcriptional regulator